MAIGYCLSAIAVTAPPLPRKPKPLPIRHHDLPRGAQLLMQKSSNPTIQQSLPPVVRVNVIPIQYPAGIDPDLYWWNVQTTVDFTNWTTLLTNVTGTVDLTNNLTEPCRFFRLSGRLTP